MPIALSGTVTGLTADGLTLTNGSNSQSAVTVAATAPTAYASFTLGTVSYGTRPTA